MRRPRNRLFFCFVGLLGVSACAGAEGDTGDGDSDDGGTGGTGGAGGSGAAGGGASGGSGGSGGAHEPACPDLSGTFDCPEVDTQAAYTLTITQAANSDGSVVYTFDYGGAPSTIIASLAGFDQRGWIGQCVAYVELDAMAYYFGGQMRQATYHLVNADGDYQADNGGQTQIVCPRAR